MEKKKYIYDAILAIWSMLKTYGFDPLASDDDAKWEALIEDGKKIMDQFQNPTYPRINAYVRAIVNTTLFFYEKDPVFMKEQM